MEIFPKKKKKSNRKILFKLEQKVFNKRPITITIMMNIVKQKYQHNQSSRDLTYQHTQRHSYPTTNNHIEIVFIDQLGSYQEKEEVEES